MRQRRLQINRPIAGPYELWYMKHDMEWRARALAFVCVCACAYVRAQERDNGADRRLARTLVQVHYYYCSTADLLNKIHPSDISE